MSIAIRSRTFKPDSMKLHFYQNKFRLCHSCFSFVFISEDRIGYMKRRNQYKRTAAAGEESNDSSTTDQSNDLLSDTADDSLLMPPPPSNNKRKGGDTTSNDTQGIIGSNTEPISNTTTKKKKTSLFSAVISRSSTNKSKFNNNAHNKKQSIATSTKPSSLATSAANNKMSTPTKSLTNNNTKSTKKSPMHSPGGYEILQALDNANLYNDQQDAEDGGGKDKEGKHGGEGRDTEGKDEFHDATVYFTKSTSSTRSRRYGYDNMGGREKKRETKEDLSSLFLDSSIVEATRHGIDDFNSLKKVGSNINDVPNSVGMIDWSIKRRLRLDCIPGNCLPGGGIKGGLNEGKVRQLAIQQLSSSGDNSYMGRSLYSHSMRATEEEMAASKWLSSTMYYQHPAVHPLPLSMLVDSSSSSGTSNSSTAGGKNGEGKGDLSSYILQPQSVHNKVRLVGVGSMGGLGLSNLPLLNDKDKSNALLGNQQRRERNTDKASVSTVSSLLYQRRRDWQECFRSLFQLWKSKLKDVDTSSTASSSQDLISRNSFYVISSNQIVLFRCGYMKQHSGDISPQLVPMVVSSSTTPYLRSKLKSMGVELRLFTSKRSDTTSSTATEEEGSYEVFSESLLQTNDDATPTQEDSAEVHAELNAIKHADDEKGKVTVEVKKRKVRPRYNDPTSTSGSKGSSLPPLFVYGIDDCNVVYELFMNTYGLSSVDNQSAGMSKATTTNASPPVSDVPLLLCRSLGSNCLHTTLRTLSVSSRRDTGFMNQVYHQDNQQRHPSTAAATNAKATLELRGPILPCALRDLTCAAINLMLLDKKSRQLGKHQDSDYFLQTNKNDNTETSSSHQFAMFLQVHEGESSTSMSKMTTGSSSSVNFNGSNISLMPSQEEGDDNMDDKDDTSSWYECRQGDCINVLVWDVSRTSVVSFHPTEA